MSNKNSAIAWLEQFSEELDSDSDIIDAMPIEDVRRELHEMGADVEGFHKKIAKALGIATIKHVMEQVTEWVSSLFWLPDGIAQPLTAADISEQMHTFQTKEGEIRVACVWEGKKGNEPAYIWLSWETPSMPEGGFLIQFVNPDTKELLYEVSPRKTLKGNVTFTSEKLGFDPEKDKWGIYIPQGRKE